MDRYLQAPEGTSRHGDVAVAGALQARAGSLALHVAEGDDGEALALKVLVDLDPLPVGAHGRAVAAALLAFEAAVRVSASWDGRWGRTYGASLFRGQVLMAGAP